MRRPLSYSIQLPSYKILFLSLLGMLTVQTLVSTIMRHSQSTPSLFAGISHLSATVQAQTGYGYPPSSSPTPAAPLCKGANTTAELIWYPPVKSDINTLSTVINGTGTYGFVFNSSQAPLNTYDWCSR